LASACALSLLTACGEQKHEVADEANGDAKVDAMVSAVVQPVTVSAFVEEVEAVGTIVGAPGGLAQLAAPTATRVARVLTAVGARVAAGAPLVELEQAPFTAALVSAERSLEVAEKADARARRLADAGVLPRKDAELAAADLAGAQLNAATARRARELSVLRAPFRGAVTRLSASVGASVDPSQPLVELADTRTLDALFTLAPADAARLRVGAGVVLQESGGAPAPAPTVAPTVAPAVGLARGRIVDIAAAVDTATGGVAVRVRLERPARELRLGEPVTGRLAVSTRTDAVIVPNDALVPTGEGFRVFVVDSAGIAHATDVMLGGRGATGAWVREGLKAGDRIVTVGAYGMDDLAKVVPGKR
jgi:RND family efflux transporter MFP subunit